MKKGIQNIEEYVTRAQNGEQAAACLLYELYAGEMYNTIMRIVKQRELAEDITHDSFLIAFHQLSKLRNVAKFGHWLKKIVINEALREYKRRLPIISIQDEAWDSLSDLEIESTWWDELELSDLMEHINYLPDGARYVFILFAIEDLSHKEIAERLGITESTSKTQYRRAKALLKERITLEREKNG